MIARAHAHGHRASIAPREGPTPQLRAIAGEEATLARPVRVAEAAAALGMSPRRLWRLIRREGAPVAFKGHRGGGGATLVDVAALRAWHSARHRADERALRELAASYPQELADTLHEAWQHADGLDKRKLARVLVEAWELGTARHLARLRERVPDLPDGGATPEPIQRMLRAAGHS